MMTDSDFLKLQPMFDAIRLAVECTSCPETAATIAAGLREVADAIDPPPMVQAMQDVAAMLARPKLPRPTRESIGQAKLDAALVAARARLHTGDDNVVELPPVWVSEMPGPCDACGSLRHLTIAHPANEVQQ